MKNSENIRKRTNRVSIRITDLHVDRMTLNMTDFFVYKNLKDSSNIHSFTCYRTLEFFNFGIAFGSNNYKLSNTKLSGRVHIVFCKSIVFCFVFFVCVSFFLFYFSTLYISYFHHIKSGISSSIVYK